MTKYKLSICAIAKNEGAYLLEWLEFHKLVGVEHFYFYDNESNDNTREILDLYEKSGYISYHYWDSQKIKKEQAKYRKSKYAPHKYAVQHCLENYCYESEWIAFLDLDEFLFSPKKNDLKDVIEDYRNFPGVLVNWLSFGSSGYLTKPKGLQIENFTKRAKGNHRLNRFVKTICQPSKVQPSGEVHKAIPIEGSLVTENKMTDLSEYKDRTIIHSSKNLRIHHYITRSKEEHLNRPRWKPEKGMLERFERLNRECNEVEDLTMQRFIFQVKRNVEKIKLAISSSQLQSLKEEIQKY